METASFTFNGKNDLNHFKGKFIFYPSNLTNIFYKTFSTMINSKLHIILFVLLLSLVLPLQAKVKITILHGKSQEGFVRVKIKNETNAALACYVAIDGRKVKFTLPPFLTSKWYQATDSRFNYRHFSTWCDYLELHPEYKNNF